MRAILASRAAGAGVLAVGVLAAGVLAAGMLAAHGPVWPLACRSRPGWATRLRRVAPAATMAPMVDTTLGRFSAHLEYGQSRTFPIEHFPYLREAVATDPLQIAPLMRPQVPEPPRFGENGIDCRSCTNSDDEYLWTDPHWRIHTAAEPQPMFLVLLQPREHYQDLPDLPPERAAELGTLLQRMESALRALGDVGQVHTHKWGDGGAHLHLWQIARPLGMVQARGVGLTVWLRALPPLPPEVWQAAGRDFAREMARGGGTAAPH